MQLPAYISLFLWREPTLYSLLYTTLRLHYSPTSFLYEIIKVSLTMGLLPYYEERVSK